MIPSNIILIQALKDSLNDSMVLSPVAELFALIESASREFNLAADSFADVNRIPAEVTDLEKFLTMLRNIKKRIDDDALGGARYNRDEKNQITGRQPDYMTDGSLKLYKTSICAIHAIVTWASVTPATGRTGTLAALRDSVCVSARSEPNFPEGLTSGGKKLWSATFSADNIRSPNVVACILRWACTSPTASTSSKGTSPGQLSTAAKSSSESGD